MASPQITHFVCYSENGGRGEGEGEGEAEGGGGIKKVKKQRKRERACSIIVSRSIGIEVIKAVTGFLVGGE